MTLEIETIETYPCCTNKFTVNGKEAKEEDFGYTDYSGDWDKYTCSCWFIPYEIVSPNILEKYEISKGEYHQICAKLKEKLRINKCGWCS